MSSMLTRSTLALITIVAVSACEDEPMSPHAPGVDEAADQASVSAGRQDRAAILQIVNTFDEAWTGGDPVRYAAQYASADWVGPDGTILSDPAALTQLYGFIIGVALAGTTRESIVRRLTFLTGTIAVLDLDVRVTGFEPAEGVVPWRPGVIRALEKHVLQKNAGEWRIIQHQQVIAAPTAP